jgi:hypothetical protein
MPFLSALALASLAMGCRSWLLAALAAWNLLTALVNAELNRRMEDE